MDNPSREEVIEIGRKLDPANFDLLNDHDGPGAFEATGDKPLALALDLIYLHGFADNMGGDVHVDRHGSRVGRFVLWTDSLGFKAVEEFDSPAKADEAVDAAPSMSDLIEEG